MDQSKYTKSQSASFLPQISSSPLRTEQSPFLIPYCEDCFDKLPGSFFVLQERTLCSHCLKRNARPSDLYYELNESIHAKHSSQSYERLTQEDLEQTAKVNSENTMSNRNMRDINGVWNGERANPYLILLKQIDSRSGRMGQILVKKYNEIVERENRQIDFMRDMNMPEPKPQLSQCSLLKECMSFLNRTKQRVQLKARKIEIVLRLKNRV